MSRWRQARRARRYWRQQLRAEHLRATAAMLSLQHQYRAAPVLPLALSAVGGWLLGRQGGSWRPPLAVFIPGLRWGFAIARGLLL